MKPELGFRWRHSGTHPAPRFFGACWLVAAVLTSAIGCSSSRGAAEAESEIRRLDAEWSDAAEKGREVERIVSFWADDAVVLPPGGPPIRGKTAIREYVRKSLEMPGFGISWKTGEVVVSRGGDLAYATGTNRVTFNGPDGKPVTVQGKAVTVWQKDDRGVWKCVADIWNDAAPPSP
jgi:uncharacterized protein (TIGR02246 family)